MPNHQIGSTFSLSMLVNAYHADPPTDADAHFLLFQGNEILALCLRYKNNPEPAEVWVGDDPVGAKWGERLAALKAEKTIPLYYAPRNRTLYTYKGHHLITGDTQEPEELAKRKGPVPLSRIVFIKPVPTDTLPRGNVR